MSDSNSTHTNFVAGQWMEGVSARANINPSDTGDTIGRYTQADHAQTELAIAAAHAAAPSWGLSNPQVRADALDRIGSEILARKDELGELLSREEGKTRPEGIGEVARAGAIFKFFAQEALRLRGDKLASVRPNIEVEVTREPVGVVGVIAPWNFPAAIPAWKIAPALAYGNTVLFKPAELVPGTAWALSEIISRAGLPQGVFNLLMGPGSVVGQALLNSPQVNALSFTGSVATGARVAQAAVQRGAKFQLEMGGKNPCVVLDDADLDLAVNCVVQSAFYSTGQRCTAASRIIVQKGIYKVFLERLAAATAALRVGHALHAETQIGPVVDASQLAQNLRYIAMAKAEGARHVCGGETLNLATPGHYLSPALFADCDNAMRHCQEEIFGPVASVIPADDYEHALQLANDTPFGLSSGICTGSLKYASHFKRHAQAGMVMVNLPTAGVDYHVPFGGRKASSMGSREQGSYAAEFFTTVKTSYLQA
ncbi:aldehyde dehydrogenase family protein [Roseateles oligotrophus]|uniref:Aldehyde dehydrogenase family protein n=1 Tax=Roseateles oligotrophus TaxID=1769250 RepID=A0ABT2Y8Q5_9BURK|nr:aldehyde dehydrogenase family protein [Roseateles oligotrophus]MCV2366682.1 aldehyde dehydrogenase family protein [Roseateles oligotrophus]